MLWNSAANNYALTKFQGSNLPFEDNSQMASTRSTFTSHKCVSTSLGMGTAQNNHFLLIKSLPCSCLKHNSLYHWTQQNRTQLYSTSLVHVTSGCKQHVLQSRMWAMESLSAMCIQIFTGASQRLEPVKMLFVPFLFSMSRFQGPSFRCNRIVVIVTLLEAIEGIPDSTKIIIFEGMKTSTIFTRDYFMSENLRVDI